MAWDSFQFPGWFDFEQRGMICFAVLCFCFCFCFCFALLCFILICFAFLRCGIRCFALLCFDLHRFSLLWDGMVCFALLCFNSLYPGMGPFSFASLRCTMGVVGHACMTEQNKRTGFSVEPFFFFGYEYYAHYIKSKYKVCTYMLRDGE